MTQVEIVWNDMAAAGAIAMALPLGLALIARRYLITGLPSLIFIVRPNSPLLPPVDQPHEHVQRQEALRRRLLEESDATVAWIATPAELELSLLHALMELKHGPIHKNSLRQLRTDAPAATVAAGY